MNRIVFVIAAVALICTQPVRAAPMTCSTEQKACLAPCSKFPPAVAKDCIDACRARFNYCRHTGCWDNGSSRYCGVLRQ
jgi:hypothetical protein